MSEFDWGKPLLVAKSGVNYVAIPVDRYNELLERAGIGVSVEVKHPKKEEKAPKVRKSVDKGKIKALHEAGWSAFDIAKDMGISISAVYNNLPPLKK